MADYVDGMFELMQNEVALIRTRVKVLEERTSVDVAFAPPQSALADAPTGLLSTEWRWITDGRFGAETAGNGTGVMTYYRPNTSEWISLDSGIAVTV